MGSRGRVIVSVVITAAWFGLAVLSALNGARWFVPVCYIACGLIMSLVVVRSLSPSRPKSSTTTEPSALGRARRSGNPAIRAHAEDEPGAHG
jgi:hypothetical protein